MNAPTKAETQAVNHAAREAISDAFHRAKHEAHFCNEVVKLAAFAAAMQHRLQTLDSVMRAMPQEAQRIRSMCSEAASDWQEMDSNALHWALNNAALRTADALEAMETAFMAMERGGPA